MEKMVWLCLSLVSLSGPLWALPMASGGHDSSWLTETDADGRLRLEALSSWNRGSLLHHSLMGLAGVPTEASTSQAGLRPNSFKPRESIKEALLRRLLLHRLLPAKRKPFKKRGNLSECFWKYCV